MFKQMSLVECNYEIYDKELLAIVRAFEKWHSKCVEISMKELIKIINDHRNLEIFMSIKSLNRRQARWVEFLSKFNFRISYRLEAQEVKSNNLIKRSQDLSKSNADIRRQFQQQTVLKKAHLELEMIKAIKLALMLIDDISKLIFRLAHMIHYMIENDEIHKLAKNDINFEKIVALIVANQEAQHQHQEQVDETLTSKQLARNIKIVYVNDDDLKSIMNAKVIDARKLSRELIKKNYQLQLIDCELRDDMLYVQNRLYVSQNEVLYIEIIKHMHESSSASHFERFVIYDLINRYYYWSQMTYSIKRYVKVYYICRRIKVFRENKHELLRSLLISNRYWQSIFCDFIISLLICKRNDRLFQHIMMMINRLSKKKKFISMNSLKIEVVIQVFMNYIWREENYLDFIIFDKDRQFVTHFWQRLCQRLRIKSKLFIAFHLETDDQIENVNEILK